MFRGKSTGKKVDRRTAPPPRTLLESQKKKTKTVVPTNALNTFQEKLLEIMQDGNHHIRRASIASGKLTYRGQHADTAQ